MVIDKGLGAAATGDWLALAADFVDFVKFGFGTAMLYSPRGLQQKVRAIKEAGVDVLPGGTLLETAFHGGAEVAFFAWARAAGFTCVEVSDGTVELPRGRRRELIARARDEGFRVLSEVGKKDPARPLDVDGALEQIEADLAAGADKVIVEGRDSGRDAGIFDGQGAVRDESFARLAKGLPQPDDVIWEAPLPSQQRFLLARLGPYVNLGNVQPPDVVTLEAMRRGLRSDTLRLRLQGAPLWQPRSEVEGAFGANRGGFHSKI